MITEFGGKRSCLKRIRGYKTGEEEVEVSTLLLGNDKNNVIANYVFIKLLSKGLSKVKHK